MTVLHRLRKRDDEGFTLVEAVVALSVIGVVMSAFAVAMLASIRAGAVARQNQQSGDLLNRAVEEVRSLGYSQTAMDPADVTTDDGGLISPCGTDKCITVNGVAEKLAMATGGSVSPHISTSTVNAVPFTIARYVTTPADSAGASYRRLVVRVSWAQYGKERVRQTSTVIADTRRGLPLPIYKWTSVGSSSVTVNPGGSVVFGFQLANNGARDTWNISTDQPSLGWTYVFDNGDSTYDSAVDTTPVTDTTGDGVIDTGALEPATKVVIWALRTVPTSPATEYSSVAKFTATSYAESTYFTDITTTVNVITGVVTPTASASPTATASPTASTCPSQGSVPSPSGVTQTAVWLHNVDSSTTVTSTTARTTMVLDTDTLPSAATLYNYSTDDGVPTTQLQQGRALKPSALGTGETDALKYARFQMRVSQKTTLSGTVTAKIWAVPQSTSSSDGVDLTFYLRTASKTGSTYVFTTQATQSYSRSAWGCSTFNELTVALPVDVDLANNDYLELFVVNTGSNDVRLAYGAADYPAQMVVPFS